ncbi:MAG: endo-1,4-beta-xylanase [Planctomycetota bacterium]|nr:endo-1,4-beta-xylanase [Planctomycetota bacterium]
MGQMRFVTPTPERITPDLVEKAYLSSLEGIPWNCQTQLVNNSLVVNRANDESGNLNIPWIAPGHGPLMISTTSLMQRPEAYQLEVELARGTLNRLRNSVQISSLSGWDVPSAITDEMHLAQQLFIRAATSQHIPSQAAHWAQESLTHSLQGIENFALQRARFLLHHRQQQEEKLSTLLATRSESSELRSQIRKSLPSAFNSMGVTTSWKRISPDADKFKLDNLEKQLRWCHRKGLKVIAGPLVQLDQASVPDWVYLWEDDFPTIENYFNDYIREIVTRFSDQVHIWNSVANMNVDNCLSLSEEQLLHLAVSSIETLRKHDNKKPLIVTISQPWGEYLADTSMDMSPMTFAELLIRADLGINGIGLEINWGFHDKSTLPRDLLELSQQIDRWSKLGMPLVIYLTLSELSSDDSQDEAVAYNSDDTVSLTSRSRNVLSILASKPAVQALVWNQLTDSKKSSRVGAGLFDVNGKPKPILKDLHDLRTNYLA